MSNRTADPSSKTTESMRRHIRQLVVAAPALSEEKRQRIAGIIHSGR